MFYSQDILQKRGGKFGIIWIAATRGTQLSKREYSAVNIRRTCEDIINYITLQAIPDADGLRPRFSLYLSSQLMFGVSRVYYKQAQYLFADTTTLSLRFPSTTSQSTTNIDLRIKKPDPMLIPETIPGETSHDINFGRMLDYDDAHLDQIQDIEVWTYEGKPYDTISPPSLIAHSPEFGPDGQQRPDILLPTESPKTPQHLSFRADHGHLMQVPNASITLRDDVPIGYRSEDITVPGEQDLPPPDLMLQELTGVEQLPEMAAETVDLILGENGAIPGEFPLDQELGGIEMAPLDVQMPEGGLVEDLLPHTTENDTTVTDKGLGNEPSLTEEEMMKPTEETPAVMIDPGALWVEDGPQQRPPASPGVTPTQPPVDKRARLRANLSLNLSPIVHADTPRTKRRKQLLFADNVIQIPQQRLKHQVQNGQETCKRMEYPQPHASRSQNLFTRPYNRLIQRNPRLLALWTHNTRTHPITEPSESDIEYPIWTVPELGADTSSSGSSERGAEGPTDPHISPIKLLPLQEEEFIYEEPVPQPDLGVSITALREASVSHIELPRDASLRDVSEHGLVSDVTSLHASLLSRSDTPHTLNVTAEPQTESAHKSAQMQQAATSIEELWDEPTLMLGEQFTLHDIPENGELPAPPGDVTLDSSSLKPLFVPGPAVSPIPDRPPVSPRLEEGLETVPPEVENGVQEEPPADPKVPSPLPHHQLMKLIKKTTRKQQSVTFHEVCPPTIKNRDQAARLFTALLDLCALQRLSVKQEAPYADIYISKGRKWTNPAAPPAIL